MEASSSKEVWYSAEDLTVELSQKPAGASACPELQQIIAWLKLQVPFHGRTDEDFAKRFLVGCKYDVKKTKQRITRYYENRRKYPDLLKNRDITEEKILELFTRGLNVCDYDEAGPVRMLSDFSRIRGDDNVVTAFRLAVIHCESLLLINDFVNDGVEWIINAKDVPLSFITQVTPKVLHRLVSCLLMGLPVRVKGIHIINVHPAIMIVINCFKMLLSPKLRGRLHLHRKSWPSLFKYVPRNSLPVEYGGTGGTLQEYIARDQQSLLKAREYLLDDEKYGFQ